MDILKYLDNHAISYDKYEHEAVYTVEEAQRFTSHIPGVHCKNLFLKNRKGKRHLLVVLEESRPLNLKELSDYLGLNGLSFASKERLFKYLKVEPGAVSPLGLIHDEKKEVEVYFGKEVYNSVQSAFHPNNNTMTLVMNTKDLLMLIEDLGYTIKVI